MSFNNYYIIANKNKDPEHQMTNRIMGFLKDMGKQCGCQDIDEDTDGTQYRYTNADIVPENTDCVIVLGGDGTLLQAARDLIDRELPMLGVNIGTLGFLTDTDMDNVKETLCQIDEGRFEIDSRMMLDGYIYRNNELIYQNTALNDVVINRRGILSVIDFDVCVNDEYLNSYSADGVIISTATGSTAYSLSAGGPIVQPNAQLLMLTPICPHTLNKRSIIFGADDEISIQIGDNKKLKEERVATFDGEMFCHMISGDRIVIKRSDKKTRLIKTNKLSFLQRIRTKM